MANDKLPLKIDKCKRSVDCDSCSIIGISSLEKLLQSKLKAIAQVVLWQNNKVIFGKFDGISLSWGESFAFDAQQLVEFRAFNKDEELLVENGNYRYILDGEGEEVEFVETYSRLWGRKIAAADEYSVLEDAERKMTLVIPVVGNSDYYELGMRSYIGYVEKTNQASYTMYRYTEIREGRE